MYPRYQESKIMKPEVDVFVARDNNNYDKRVQTSIIGLPNKVKKTSVHKPMVTVLYTMHANLVGYF